MERPTNPSSAASATVERPSAKLAAAAAATVNEAEVHLTKFGPNGRPAAEIFVAEGTPFKGIVAAQQAVYRDLLTRVGLKVCEGCRSGLDVYVRQRYENVVRVNLETGQIGP